MRGTESGDCEANARGGAGDDRNVRGGEYCVYHFVEGGWWEVVVVDVEEGGKERGGGGGGYIGGGFPAPGGYPR